MTRKEELLTIALNNFRKKVKHDSLFDYLDGAYISDEEYEKEIDEHPEKYVINVNMFAEEHLSDIPIIKEIIDSFDFPPESYDEIAEMFSYFSNRLFYESLFSLYNPTEG